MSGLLADAIEFGHAGWRWVMTNRIQTSAAAANSGQLHTQQPPEDRHPVSAAAEQFPATRPSSDVAGVGVVAVSPEPASTVTVGAAPQAAPPLTPDVGAPTVPTGCWYTADREHTACDCNRRGTDYLAAINAAMGPVTA